MLLEPTRFAQCDEFLLFIISSRWSCLIPMFSGLFYFILFQLMQQSFTLFVFLVHIYKHRSNFGSSFPAFYMLPGSALLMARRMLQ